MFDLFRAFAVLTESKSLFKNWFLREKDAFESVLLRELNQN
jgi:hypothetical protein